MDLDHHGISKTQRSMQPVQRNTLVEKDSLCLDGRKEENEGS